MKISLTLTTLLTATLLALPAFAQDASPPTTAPAFSTLLQKAIYQEETVGDLNAASQLYQQLLDAAQADRPFAAQAAYRLGTLQIKQKKIQEGVTTLIRVKTDYPEQKDVIAKANTQLAQNQTAMPDEDLKKIVDAAVLKISTLTVNDPEIPRTLSTLNGIDGKRAAALLATWLTSEVPEERRAAIYILGQEASGGREAPISDEDVAPAVPNLLKALKNDEDMTRAMASDTLGKRRIPNALTPLSNLALHDPSTIVRISAVHALALLGDLNATDTLTQALQDPDKKVADYARSALRSLQISMPTTTHNPVINAAIQSAVSTAQGWLVLIDNNKFADSYTAAAPSFQKSLTTDDWQKQLTQVRQPLGKPVRSLHAANYSTSLPGVPDGQYVIAQYSTDFQNKKAAVETITLILNPNGKWQVSGYFIK